MRRNESEADASLLSGSSRAKGGSIHTSLKDHDTDLADEEADQVADMPGTDIFERSHGRSRAAFVGSVGSADDLSEQQLKANLASGPRQKKKSAAVTDFDAFARRGPSFVQMKRDRQK